MKNYTQLSHEFVRWKNKINNVNRYYTDTRLLDLLRDNRDLIEYRIPRGEPFFRGRIFNIDDVAPTNSKYENWIDDRNNIFEGYGKKDSGAPPRRNAAEGRLNGKGISFHFFHRNIFSFAVGIVAPVAQIGTGQSHKAEPGAVGAATDGGADRGQACF